jgi:hypothetical protein
MSTNYNTEREQVIRELNDKLIFLAQAMRGAESDGDTKEYRALLKSYTDTAKLHLQPVREMEAEANADTDALQEFTSVYDTRGLTII